jgi:hypothetical protein
LKKNAKNDFKKGRLVDCMTLVLLMEKHSVITRY